MNWYYINDPSSRNHVIVQYSNLWHGTSGSPEFRTHWYHMQYARSKQPNSSSVLSSMHVVCAVKVQLVYAMVITQIIKTLSCPGDCHSTSWSYRAPKCWLNPLLMNVWSVQSLTNRAILLISLLCCVFMAAKCPIFHVLCQWLGIDWHQIVHIWLASPPRKRDSWAHSLYKDHKSLI